MTDQTATLLIDAALFGLAGAGVALALGITCVCVGMVYKAAFSTKAKRERAFQARCAKNRAHYRKILNIA